MGTYIMYIYSVHVWYSYRYTQYNMILYNLAQPTFFTVSAGHGQDIQTANFLLRIVIQWEHTHEQPAMSDCVWLLPFVVNYCVASASSVNGPAIQLALFKGNCNTA